ncbi:MAG: DEAD/DEAH box helicase [Treponema sp.]|nr:DEAD/DEAH box helicase [Treponema sp.]
METRSGDTPQSERRRFLRNPPAILALTPESLAILLLNPPGRRALSTVRYVILDEIHAALGTKRGAFLSCQIDRLSLVAGEFQRVSLSATVRPAQAAADFSGGLRAVPGGYEKRRVRIVAPRPEKHIELTLDFPGDHGKGREGEPAGSYGPRYHVLVDIILERIRINRSAGETGTVLVFTGSRRRAERIAYLVNERAGFTLALVHHGSLSKEVRRSVEARLAGGTAACVVATGSLELGIDIGGVGEVILAGCPDSSAAALQRIGRSGHGVGLVSRGRLVPFTGVELLEAVALAGAVRDREIEETRPIANPLDILAQIILALCVERPRNIDELYRTLRGFFVFQSLSRAAYDRTIRMLAGRYAGVSDAGDGEAGVDGENAAAGVRLRELKPRLFLDAFSGELTAAPGALLLLYASGGVITNRGSYSLRLAGGVKIGELDEEFVWERRPGDSFEFGGRAWSIAAIGPEAVEAVPLERKTDFVPFWKADVLFRSPVIARRVLELLEDLNGPGEPAPETFAEQGISPQVFEELMSVIRSQRQAQNGTPLPGRAVLPVEILDDPVNRGEICSVLLHGFRGGAVLYPLAMALAEELEESLGLRIEAIPGDTAILILLPRRDRDDPESLIRRAIGRLGEEDRGERRFRARLESSGIFGAAFREAAERALLLPRAGFGKRSPLWMTRRRAKRLFDIAAPLGDFPVIAEAWRTCLADQFDMPGFRALLRDLACGNIVLSFFRTSHPSPFARDMVWKGTNVFMYEYDGQPDRRGASAGDQVIAEALGFDGGDDDPAGRNRPPLPAGLVADFCARLRRELPGWVPEDEPVLAEWVKERVAIPADEWDALLAAAPPELRERCRADPSLHGRILRILRKGARIPSLVHREYTRLWEEEGAPRFLGLWLRYEGPVSLSRIQDVFGLSGEEAGDAAAGLFEAGELVRRVRIADSAEDFVCDRENYELLLRLTRKKARPLVRERPAPALIPYLALRQGIWGARKDLPAGNAGTVPWEKLAGLSAPAALWETAFFPARLPDYRPELLDGELRAGRFLWYGTGKERAAFCMPEDFEPAVPGPEAAFLSAAGDPGFFDRPRDFWEIREAWRLDTPACAGRLWSLAWQGFLSADSWEPLRRGIERGFIPKDAGTARGEAGLSGFAGIPGARRRPVPRALRDRWRDGPPVPGRWFSLLSGDEGDCGSLDYDPLDEEERSRDRVRLLLSRWGVLCRPLLERETGPFSWSRLLPAIRRLELAGELTAGRFFAGINSLQFASPRIPAELEEAEACRGIYRMNAADPASPAGLDIAGLDPRLPARLAAAWLCFRGSKLAARAERNGKTLGVFVPPDDPDLPLILEFLTIPRIRQVGPVRKLCVETINGKTAAESPYANALKALGFLPDRGKLILW